MTGDELQGFLRGSAVSVDDVRGAAAAVKAAYTALDAREGWPDRLKNAGVKHGPFVEVWRDYGEVEQLVARDLGVDRDRLVAEMVAFDRSHADNWGSVRKRISDIHFPNAPGEKTAVPS